MDLGTNAELVLFANNKFYACAAAAGPCFEGAMLTCGMGGIKGAIDRVFIKDTDDGGYSIEYTTINSGEPLGLCGSGVIDILAALLEKGIVDQTGKLLDTCEQVRPVTGGTGFFITDTVYLSDMDVREVQLAKAAIRAGIEVLLSAAGVEVEDVDDLYIAGGFGSALRLESASVVGLIPPVLEEKVVILGNAALYGALRYITEKNALINVKSIKANTKYLELSGMDAFFTAYIAHMTF